MKRLGRAPAPWKRLLLAPGYAALRARSLGSVGAGGETGRSTAYPKNHRFRLHEGVPVPSFDLYCRWRVLADLYPQPLESLLDVGCCRGYFVLEAAGRPGCRGAVGIDVSGDFVAAAERARDRTGCTRASFHRAALSEVARDPQAFGGPFQTVLVVNVYHYLFWGSDAHAEGTPSHDELLGRLAEVSSDRVLLSSPLDLEDCPRNVRRRATRGPGDAGYSMDAFLRAAERRFEVTPAGRLGKRPLLLLQKRG